MERDFKWLTAVVDAACKMCAARIRQGDGFYYEAKNREPHCQSCGRAIRLLGYDKANAAYGGDSISKLLREFLGEGH